MRQAFLVLILVACGHPPEAKHVVAGTPSTPPAGAPVAKGAPKAGGGSAAPVVALKDVGCPAPTCVFHTGGAAYFTCLAGGSGMCFHFGGPCSPADRCMYDPGDRAYKQCATPVEGTCAKYGAPCAPASKCMFDPADGLHHRCDAPAGGSCASYGALCAP